MQRKKIIDCFLFLNEYEILEGRLEYLYDVVDYFVIVESDMTYNGNQKNLNFIENMSKYKKYLDKILYFPIHFDSSSYKLDVEVNQLDYSTDHWQVEFNQRNHISTALKFFNDDDVVIISDLDEMPNKNAIPFVVEHITDENPFIGFKQDMFYYNFKQKQLMSWFGPVAGKNKFVVEATPNGLRGSRNAFPHITNGGYHLSYWTTIDNMKYKIINFAHQELNKPQYLDDSVMQQRIDNGKDLFGRENPFVKVRLDEIDPEILRIFGKYQKYV